MGSEWGASLRRTWGGRLTQPAACQSWLSGECLNPHPGVRPRLKDTSSPSQTTPGEEEGPQPLGPQPCPGVCSTFGLFVFAQYSQFGC